MQSGAQSWAGIASKPASLFEILTFGYKAAWRIRGPLAWLTLPLALLCGFLEACYQEPQDFWKGMGVLVLTATCTLYGFYIVARYTRDALMSESAPVFSYWLPRINCWGSAWIGLLHSFTLVVIIVGDTLTIGRIHDDDLARWFQSAGYWGQFWAAILMLVIYVSPVAVLGSYANVAFGLYLAEYLERPGRNIVAAMGRWLRLLLRVPPGRLMMLGFVAFLLCGLLALPVWEIGAVKSAVADMNPSVLENPLFFVCNVLVSALDNWFYMAMGFGGFVAAMFRLHADLKFRHEQTPGLIEFPEAPPVADSASRRAGG